MCASTLTATHSAYASQCSLVRDHGALKAHFERVGGQFVADGCLRERWDRTDQRRHVLEIEIVTYIDDQAAITGRLCRRRARTELGIGGTSPRRSCVAPGVDLDPICARVRTRSTTSVSGSTNTITLLPIDFSTDTESLTIGLSLSSSLQPSSDVKAVGASGTIVHCSGLTRVQRLRNR